MSKSSSSPRRFARLVRAEPLALRLACAATATAAAATLLAAGPLAAQADTPVPGPPLGVTGTVRWYGAFPSRYVASRNVEVWLPPGYARDTAARYPVVYAQDGQNVFSPATSYTGVDWGVDETMTRLIAEGRVRPAIVVAVWNTPERFQEYTPQKAISPETAASSEKDIGSGVPGLAPFQGPILSDAYLRFIVEELKPFIDRTYRTRTGPGDTFVMGSSMGGLIALYAVAEYPRVFGGAACLSTHWPVAGGAVVSWVRGALPDPASHRIWFDHGTATLDSLYAPYQRRVDAAMKARGYVEGKSWITRVYPGADHSERSWRVRVAEPLEFLLGR